MTVRYPKRFDAKLLKRYLKEGRGTGEGALYNPWVQIYDLPSEGLSSIVPGWKTAIFASNSPCCRLIASDPP